MCVRRAGSVRYVFLVFASAASIAIAPAAHAQRPNGLPPGGVIHVPGDQPTIQSGVDAASDGDVVLVAEGVYAGTGNRDIDFHGKAIVLRAEAAQVVIDCQAGRHDQHRGFSFHSGESGDSVVEGFTVRNGFAAIAFPFGGGGSGGGALCEGSSPTFRDCVFKLNHAHVGGGGVACVEADPTFTRCMFLGNEVPWTGYATGGGGLYTDHSSPKLVDCLFEDNSSLDGGAAYCSGAAPHFERCSFRKNHPPLITSNERGGALFLGVGSPVLEDCVLVENTSFRGGAIWCYASMATIEGCTIEDNTASRAGGIYCSSAMLVERTRLSKNSGGAIYLDFATGVSLTRNVFEANVVGRIDSSGEGGAGAALFCDGSSPLIEKNSFRANRALGGTSARGGAIYCRHSAPTIRQNVFTGNAADVDPQFPNSLAPDWVAAGGAIYLENSSPVLGGPSAGGNTFLGNRALSGADIFKEGATAIVDARSNAFTVFPVSSYYLAPLDGFDASVDTGLRPALTADVTVSPSGVDAEGAPGKLRTLDFALSRLAPTAGNVLTIHLDPGTYSLSTTGERFPVKMIDHARLVGAGPGLSIMDAESSGGGFFCSGIHDAEISNLRVTGGFAAEGGGILCRAASPLLQGNRIDGNRAIWGGGIACTRGASPTLFGNEVVENTTVDSPYFAKLGGGVYCNGSSPRIERNVIARNSSLNYGGGGVMCNAASNPSLVNDTIAANTAGTGGGLTVWNNSHPTLRNCILWNDQAFSVPEINECCGATAVAGYSDVEGGWLGIGNFSADPLFVDESLGDYHLTGASPCIDAGDPASPPDPDASVADVGAFAFP